MATPTQQELSVSAVPAEVTAQKNARPIDKFKTYANSPEVFESFKRVLGNDKLAQMYVGSVIVAVYNKEELQACSPKSIMVSAMRAAYLHLSVDPAMKQAHLVPFGGEATLIVDYHGLIQLMSNTGLYEIINVAEVYEGEEIKRNRLTGSIEIIGEKTSANIIGWCSYFKMHNGMEKFLHMTNEECDAHGKKYSKAFNSSRSGWKTDLEKMRRKTALRCLANMWGQYSPYATAVLKGEEGVIDGLAVDMPDENKITQVSTPTRSISANMAALGFEDERTPAQKDAEREKFREWVTSASRHDLESALTKGMSQAEREDVTHELSQRPAEVDPMFRYNTTQVTMAVAEQWDEAPDKVKKALHELFTAGDLPETMTIEEAKLIKRPGTTIEGIPA